MAAKTTIECRLTDAEGKVSVPCYVEAALSEAGVPFIELRMLVERDKDSLNALDKILKSFTFIDKGAFVQIDNETL